MTCMLFGHRDAPDAIRTDLKNAIISLTLDYGVTEFLVGNNGSFDAMSQGVLSELRHLGLDINYSIVLSKLNEIPISGENNRTLFPEGQEDALHRFAISKRNDWMLRQADVLLTFVRNKFSNSYKVLSKALAKGIKAINLYNG